MKPVKRAINLDIVKDPTIIVSQTFDFKDPKLYRSVVIHPGESLNLSKKNSKA